MIERMSDFAKMGYIALKYTSKDLWEIAIELNSAYCHQGYGAQAILLFLRKIGEITPKSQFQFLVEVDNIPCQGCMKKLNAKLVGIHNLVFDCEKDAETFEANNFNMITEHMKTLAVELDIPPQKLLSHVLDYRVTLQEGGKLVRQYAPGFLRIIWKSRIEHGILITDDIKRCGVIGNVEYLFCPPPM